MAIQMIDVSKDNIDDYPPACFMKTDTSGYVIKREWLIKRFKEGLKIKILYDTEDKKIHGFIEYVPGEKAWRAVDAKNYTFIHCIWMYPNAYKNKEWGSKLVKQIIAESNNKTGVAVIASDGPFMATKEIFLKNGFKVVDEDGKEQLLVKQNKKGPLPAFRDYKKQLAKYKGWNILYSNQCPWVARFVSELDTSTKNKFTIKEITTPKQAQDAPSIYGVFNLIHDGKMLADRYISATRFKNILQKEK